MNKKQRKLRQETQKLVGIFDDLVGDDVNLAPVVDEKDLPKPREIARSIIMFWRKEKCQRCHTTYEGSLYHSAPMLQLEMQTPILHFGRMYGWRYKGIKFQPVADVSCFDHLPHKVEIIHTAIRTCPKCIHRPKVIYLPQPVAE